MTYLGDKLCAKCGLQSEEYYKNDRTCKPCRRALSIEYRNARLEEAREYDRKRSDLPKRVQLRQQYREKLPQETVLAYRKAWLARNLEKRRCHIWVNNALRDGKILKPKVCDSCGGMPVHAHHEDYTQWDMIDWLCPKCHGKRHRQINQERREASGIPF